MDRSKWWPVNVADILRSMSVAVITIDAAKCIRSMNAAAEAMLGITEAKALGRSCAGVVKSQICSTHCPFATVWERGQSTVHFNVLLEPQAGHRLPVSMCTSLLKNGRGERIGVIITIQDLRHVLGLLGQLGRTHERIARREDGFRSIFPARRGRLGNLIGKSPGMEEIMELVQVVARSDARVLIQGESGTGKELIASTIHALSQRRAGPFIKVSCAALPESLLESELFGHVRGAFTGATRDKPGRFELADKGTLFLDEVAEMSPAIQVKLLRALQEHEFERVGGTRTLRVDIRVIAASNRDLRKAVQEGRLREDLFYRLNVVPIVVPPLRERKEDIPLLIRSILERPAPQGHRTDLRLSREAMNLMMEYDWPGNVRELENAIEFARVWTAGGTILPESLPPSLRGGGEGALDVRKPLVHVMAEREREEIVKKIAACQGKVSDVAKALGVGRTTLWRKMKRYQISRG